MTSLGKCTNPRNNCSFLVVENRCPYHYNLYERDTWKKNSEASERRKSRAIDIGICEDCAIKGVRDYSPDCKQVYRRNHRQTESTSTNNSKSI